jgi:hypothetical protein
MKQITTLSQLGARLSIAKWHIAHLTRAQSDNRVNHVLYIVDPHNSKLTDYARSLGGKFSVHDKGDNTWTNFSRKGAPAFGADINYDYLIRLPEVGDVFLTLHDDSILLSPRIWQDVRMLTDEFHFGGYLDTRGIPQYEHVYLDGVPLARLRVGTWFCFGRTAHYIDRKYSMGDYRTYWKWLLNLKFRTRRISADGWRVWLNGGFDLNIRARLAGDRFCILDDVGGEPLAEHWNKITGFFVKRGLLPYADSVDEVDRWTVYLADLLRKAPDQFNFDVSFLERIAAQLAQSGISDPLLNPAQIASFRSMRI